MPLIIGSMITTDDCEPPVHTLVGRTYWGAVRTPGAEPDGRADVRARLHPQPSSIAQEGHELSQGSQIRYRPGSYHTQGSPEINLSQKTTQFGKTLIKKKKKTGSPTGTSRYQEPPQRTRK
ncbi:hypothetical protein AVEN_123483-1 [Araneus ventricosus]|uniref:Uncharacterized protein n=1 Tax=Araneus ventricosus TaxID=182803 RepID=A0A4Y2CS39_ARAVE|nr:hypothetical protein AVEN_123483-1 [Araneus ventricosus]